MDKKEKTILIVTLVVILLVTFGISRSLKIKVVDYKNENFVVNYDSTWKEIEKNNTELKLKHRKSDAILRIQAKELDSNFIDTRLEDIISDIIYSIEEQNSDYKMINIQSSPSSIYDSYSYLYEKGDMQVLINIYKKDNKLIIAFYEASNEYYDIVLDSVDIILDSLKIYAGDEVN